MTKIAPHIALTQTLSAHTIDLMVTPMKIGIVGCGAIGRKLAIELDRGAVAGVVLLALYSRDERKANEFAASLRKPPQVLPIAEMATLVDLVVEAATGSALEEIARTTLGAGKDLIVLSGGGLLGRDDLFAMAGVHGATIYVPSGAIAALDGVVAAAAGRIDSVAMVTRKPPDGLRGAPGVIEAGVDLDSITEPTIVYEGPVQQACRLFPANVNVSAALAMAGIGPQLTTIRIYVDPTVTYNTHEIVVEGEFGKLSAKIENVPTSTNPKSGVISALSVLATIKKIVSHLKVGT